MTISFQVCSAEVAVQSDCGLYAPCINSVTYLMSAALDAERCWWRDC